MTVEMVFHKLSHSTLNYSKLKKYVKKYRTNHKASKIIFRTIQIFMCIRIRANIVMRIRIQGLEQDIRSHIFKKWGAKNCYRFFSQDTKLTKKFDKMHYSV